MVKRKNLSLIAIFIAACISLTACTTDQTTIRKTTGADECSHTSSLSSDLITTDSLPNECVNSLVQTNDIVQIENENLIVTISTRGAELQSIRAKKNNQEFLWHGNAAHWARRAPLMFPVNVKFKDDRYTYRGKPYEMPRLGLVHDRNLVVTSQQKDNITLTLTANDDTLIYYPFLFRFSITYSLVGTELRHKIQVVNTGDHAMYYALGGHPGLVFPTKGGKTRNDYAITFSKAMTIERGILSAGLFHDRMVPFLDGEASLNIADPRVPKGGMLLLAPDARRIGVAMKDEPPFVEIDLGNFPNVNIWTPPEKPFVAIEPQVGHHDLHNSPYAIEEKGYLKKMPPKSIETYTFSIQFPNTETY